MMLPVPQHVAIIMDGNGRWAQRRHRHRTAGHVRGARRVREAVRAADALGIRILTLFAFSSENWNRPQAEVGLLMRLLVKFLMKEAAELHRENVQVRVIGEWDGVPLEARHALENLVQQTKNNKGLVLNFAFNYGARQEIVSAIQAICTKAVGGTLDPKQITEATVSEHLYTAGLPDPDLLIRTSGENRLSNFLLWQNAYTEFYFTDVYWPDFTAEHLKESVMEYRKRGRRFGGVENLRQSSPEMRE